jgi:hypothetical protein
MTKESSMLMRWTLVLVVVVFGFGASGQDLSSMIEQAPGITVSLLKALEKTPAFSAAVEVRVSTRSDAPLTTASGLLEYQQGNMRWQFHLKDIESPHLTSSAVALLRRVNGERLLLLTRGDRQANYLILTGPKAYLEETLPAVKLAKIEGNSPIQEQFSLRGWDGSTNRVSVKRSIDQKHAPAGVRIEQGEDIFTFRFDRVRFGAIGTDRFEVPAGFARYESFEDLAQSVLIDKMRRSLGLK